MVAPRSARLSTSRTWWRCLGGYRRHRGCLWEAGHEDVDKIAGFQMPEVICAASPIRFRVRATECLQSPFSRHPFARWAVRSFRIDAEVRLDDNPIALVLDQLVVVHPCYSRRVRGTAGVVRAEEFKSAPWLPLCEEQSSSLVDVDDIPGFDAIRSRDMHGQLRVLVPMWPSIARRHAGKDYQFC